MRIATLTMNPSVDLSAGVERVSPDDKLRADGVRREPGGGGINVARVIHELGGEALACYLGGGPNGDLLETLLNDRGIPQRRVPIAGYTRQDVTISERSSGRQFRFVMPGPEIDEGECREVLRAALDGEPDILVASGSLPPGAPPNSYARLAAACREHGTRLVLDSSGAALEHALEEGVEVLKPNLRELAALAGRGIQGDDELEEVAERLVSSGKARIVLVSMGAGGAVVASREGSRHIKSPTVPVESKVGAGDSMVGGLVLALARGDDALVAARFGVAAGAAAVMTPGTELCRRADVERLAAAMRV
jgi:6-phosphofructokinase 2